MKKQISKLAKQILLFCTVVSLFFSCDSGESTGMGESLDLEAPRLTITSPSMAQYVRTSFAMKGTCFDNKKVKTVTIQQKKTDGSEPVIAYAMILGNYWECNLTLPEGTAILVATAFDDDGNISSLSKKQIILLVDDNPPQADAWYIDREIGGIRYPLEKQEDLEALDLRSVENKDAAQNVAFTLKGVATDAMGVDNITVHIDEYKDGQRTRICDVPVSNGNNYAPEFKITHEDLVSANETLATGKHYLYISYDALDVAGNQTSEPIVLDVGCFLWWPESDIPRIEQRDMIQDEAGNDILYLHVKDTFALDIFDDDSLAIVYYALLSDEEYDALYGKKTGDFKDFLLSQPEQIYDAVTQGAEEEKNARRGKFDYTQKNDGTGDVTCTLVAPSLPQSMHLVAMAQDMTQKKVTGFCDTNVFITDESLPVLFISSPQRNSIPVVDCSVQGKATFCVTGQVLDTNGAKYLEAAFVPDGIATDSAQKEEKAKNVLNALDHEALKNQIGTQEYAKITQEGITVWSLKLSAIAAGSGGYFSQDFSLPLDILNDFGEEKMKDKFFVFHVIREDGNKIFDTYRLQGDALPPDVECLSPQNDMQIIEYTQDSLTLEFKGTKPSGLSMDTLKYKIQKYDSQTKLWNDFEGGSYDAKRGTYKVVVSKQTLQQWATDNDTMPKFQFFATDIFGNTGYAQRVVLLSDLPQLKSITTGASDGTVFKKGDEVILNATFSSAVSVVGVPRLKLQFLPNGDFHYADYVLGEGKNTLVFKYTVQQGDDSPKLLCNIQGDTGPLDVTNGNIYPLQGGASPVHLNTIQAGNNLEDKKTLCLDAVAPDIVSVFLTANVTQNQGKYYCNAGKTVTATVTCTEDMIVKGSPVLTLKTSSALQGQEGQVVFKYQSTQGKKIIFSLVTTNATSNGTLSFDSAVSFAPSDIECMTDKAGNEACVKTASGETSVVIDTVSPQKPVFVLKEGNTVVPVSSYSSGEYKTKTDVSVHIQADEGDATQVSTNGGVSQIAYTTDFVLGDGEYSLLAQTTDLAGNMSPASDVLLLEIIKGFPDFELECTNPDGKYKAGEKLTFKVAFSRNVIVPQNCSAKIVLRGNRAGDEAAGAVATLFTPATGVKGVSQIMFSYTVSSPAQFQLKVAKEDLSLLGMKDPYNNEWESTKTIASDYIRDIICDAVPPSVVQVVPNGSKNTTASDGFKVYEDVEKIEIDFQEEVMKGKGNITVRQYENERETWSIPPVLSVSKFNQIYDKLDSTHKEYLVKKEGGLAKTDENTGLEIGPYMSTTQGLVESGGNLLPDTSTKYVLRWDIDIDGKTPEVENIRKALRAVNYHQYIIDVNSPDVSLDASGKKLTVKVSQGENTADEDGAEGQEVNLLPRGRKWQVCIDKGAVQDATGNDFGYGMPQKMIAQDDAGGLFWTDKVATPVIRVDRHSYGLSSAQYDATGVASIIQNQDTTPKGYVRVKIESQTPGVSIKYGTKEEMGETVTNNSNGNTVTSTTGTANTTAFVLSSVSPTTQYTGYVVTGKSDWKQSFRQLYVAIGEKTGLVASEKGTEGVYKTVVKFQEPSRVDGSAVKIHGSVIANKPVTTAGFPLRDALEEPYIKLCHKESGQNNYWWFTYEIVSDFIAGGHWGGGKGNWTQTKPVAYYGNTTIDAGMNIW